MLANLANPSTSRFIDQATPGYRPTPDEVATFQREGWVILRGVVATDRIAGLRDEILSVLRTRNQPDSFLAQTAEYLAGGAIDGWANSSTLQSAAEAFMGPVAHVYLPFTAVKGAGMGAFSFHQDNNYTLLDGPALNCWTALGPMRVANGCLRIVPRSHVQGTVASTASEECAGHRRVQVLPGSWIDVEMEAGDVCVFHRLTVHGSGPNTTDTPRVGYAVQYHRHDTRALIDGTWKTLLDRPRYVNQPVEQLTTMAGRGE